MGLKPSECPTEAIAAGSGCSGICYLVYEAGQTVLGDEADHSGVGAAQYLRVLGKRPVELIDYFLDEAGKLRAQHCSEFSREHRLFLLSAEYEQWWGVSKSKTITGLRTAHRMMKQTWRFDAMKMIPSPCGDEVSCMLKTTHLRA
ncbi:hypothetical protein ACH41H_49910 [Streptomyces sp. NPDC020800]|uniref:hypothetical protein n=1 Tax=Streptomyces sp. NPDC020800 TaxID=3365092 RepID=UPI0037A17BE4